MDFKSRISQRFRTGYIQFLYSLLVILLLMLFFWPLITVNVKSGEASVLWRRFAGGVQLDYVYGEGVHFIFPWDKMAVYNTRLQTHTYRLPVLSQHGMLLELEVAVRYRPERTSLPYLHREIGPEYFNTVIIPEVSSALREQMGVLTEDQIYATRFISVNSVTDQVSWDVQKKYIDLDAIRITKVTLPDEVAEAIRKKMIEKEKLNAYQYLIDQAKKEAERLEIQSNALSKYNNTLEKSLTPEILQWKGIEVTRELAASQNAKFVIMGNGSQGLPVILNAADPPADNTKPEARQSVSPTAGAASSAQAEPPKG